MKKRQALVIERENGKRYVFLEPGGIGAGIGLALDRRMIEGPPNPSASTAS